MNYFVPEKNLVFFHYFFHEKCPKFDQKTKILAQKWVNHKLTKNCFGNTYNATKILGPMGTKP